MAGKRSIALVEDDAVVADMYKLGLELRGFTVDVYADAPAFLEAVVDAPPELVVLDWNLPSMTGGAVVERLREDERTSWIPVLILTNVSPHGHAVEARGRGVMAWLEKIRTPPAILGDAVTAVFAQRAAQP